MSKKLDIPEELDAEILKARIVASLEEQGFEMRGDRFCLPDDLDKEKIRSLHAEAVVHRIRERRRGLERHEPSLLRRFASGKEIAPKDIYPRLVEVHPDSSDELLFRYACLHWSVPVSSGYGRRLRFLVVDQSTDKLIGLFGLGDPVFALRNRDQWIGWERDERTKRLHHVVDAYVLGAVPPYSFLLGGKLVALLAVSNEVREAFRRKYVGRASLIQRRELPGEIALITTMSALGRSSLYNRLRFRDRFVFRSVGFTRGYGEFHMSNGVYDSMVEFARTRSEATAKHELWGNGFRNRREVLQKVFSELGLPREWRNHGINREIYVAPLAKNSCEFLNGEDSRLDYFDQPASELFGWFRERWLLPRSERETRHLDWNPQRLQLWSDGEENGRTDEL